jgi:hypothetical protein
MGPVGVLAATAAFDCRKVSSPIYTLQIGPSAHEASMQKGPGSTEATHGECRGNARSGSATALVSECVSVSSTIVSCRNRCVSPTTAWNSPIKRNAMRQDPCSQNSRWLIWFLSLELIDYPASVATDIPV